MGDASKTTKQKKKTRLGALNSASRRCVAFLLAVVPFATAWDYGGILPWTKWCIAAGTCAALVLIAPTLLFRPPSARVVYCLPLLVLAMWAYGAIQTISLPVDVVAMISPASHRAQIDGESLGTPPDSIPISVAPWLTRQYLVLPAIFAALIVVATVAYRGENDVLILLVFATLSGVAISYLGVADKVNTHEVRGELIAPTEAALPFGPFVNRNNAAGYLNLCLACSAGWLVHRHRSRLSARRYDPRYKISGGTSKEKVIARIRRFVRLTDNLSVAIVTLAIIIASGVFISGSRGGMLAAIVGALVASFRSSSHTRKFTAIVTMSIGCAGLALMLGAIGMMATVQQRLAQIWGEDALRDGRLGHWQDSLVASWEYFPGGAGLGAYRYAYLPFQRVGDSVWFVNADGMPMEWLLEGGIIGIVLPLAAIACIYRMLWILAALKSTPARAAIATTAWFALPSLLVSQSFDFGILLPATTILAALIFGAVASQVHPVVRRKKHHRSKRRSYEKQLPGKRNGVKEKSVNKRSSRIPQFLLAGTCLAGSIVAVVHSIELQHQSAESDYLTRAIERWRMRQFDANKAIDNLHRRAERSAERYPDNPEIMLACADSMILNQRSLWMQQAADTETQLGFDQAWQASDPAVLRHRYHALRKAPNANSVDWSQMLLPGQSPEQWSSARTRALSALRHSTLNDQAILTLITLDFVDGSYKQSEPLIAKLRNLRSRSPQSLHRLGLMAATHPGPDTALAFWRDELQLQPQRLGSVWQSVSELKMEADLAQLVPDDPGALLYAAESLAKTPATRGPLVARINAIIESKGKSALTYLPESDPAQQDMLAGNSEAAPLRDNKIDDAQWHFFAGRVAQLEGELDEAETEFRNAVEQNPGETSWRERFAALLLQRGKQKEAIAQIERCILQSPGNRYYEELAARYREADVSNVP